MDQRKKITVTLLLLCCFALFAQNEKARSVYFKLDTPYLLQISTLLEEHEYTLSNDSLLAVYRGELLFYMEENDSIRCEVQLRKPDSPPFILGSFMSEPVRAENVRSSLLKFSIWMLILNAITAILFFVRSS